MTINQLTATQRPFSAPGKPCFTTNWEDSYYHQSAGFSVMPTVIQTITLIHNILVSTRKSHVTPHQTARA